MSDIIKLDLNDPESFERLTDDELQSVLIVGIEEQKRRSIENADFDALVEEGFEKGFTVKGSLTPWMRSGMLVCMGYHIQTSGINHICGFININDQWVWESDDKEYDITRNVPGPKKTMRTVTLVNAYEGMKFDFIECVTKAGVHERKLARSFIIDQGEIRQVDVRATKNPGRH